MKTYQQEFIELAMSAGVLKFGSFELKSGRQSPYFFNAGLFNTGKAIADLGRFYAQALIDQQVVEQYDLIFGPAYKGIPLVTSLGVALAQEGYDLPYAFNRKEIKSHGEGGQLVGAELAGKRVLIVDDVITAGTAIRESIEMIKAAGGEPKGVMVALDRMEKGKAETSAIQDLQAEYQLEVYSLINMNHLIDFLSQDTSLTVVLTEMQKYRQTYGVELS